MKRINRPLSFATLLLAISIGQTPSLASQEKTPAHQSAQKKEYRCVPCGCNMDQNAFHEAGPCPACGMALVDDAVTSIRNFLRLNEEYCTGGQPTLEQLTALKAEGTKAIINLRHTDEPGVAEESAKAQELGLRYFNIPVVFREPKEEQVDQFLKIMDEPENRPAFIHCAAAVRVGAFWMIRRVLRDGWTIEKAEDEAKKIGLHDRAPHLWEFARSYIERRRQK